MASKRKHRIDLNDTSDKKRQKGSANPWTGKDYSDKYNSILATRLRLPVYQFKDAFLQAVSNNQVVVVEGEVNFSYLKLFFQYMF